jgi:hypothetical protein
MFLNEVVAIPTRQGKMLVVKSQNKYPTFCFNGDKCPFYLLVDCLIHFYVPQVAKLLSWWLIKDDKPIFQHSKMSNKNKR